MIIDTNDIDLVEILPDSIKLSGSSTLRIIVDLSEDKQTYFAKLNEFEIDLAAYTRADLIESLKSEINFLWNNIAQEDDGNLTAKARLLKNNLKQYLTQS